VVCRETGINAWQLVEGITVYSNFSTTKNFIKGEEITKHNMKSFKGRLVWDLRNMTVLS